MRPFIAGQFDGLQLCSRRELFQLDGHAIRATLREAVALGGAGGIRDMLRGDLSSLAADRLTDEELIEHVAARIESGEMVALTRRASAATWTERTTASPPTPVEPVVQPTTEKTWIEFELVGEDGRPIPNQRYEARMPDGSVRKGRLDGAGLARFQDLAEPGMVSFSFPDLDQDAWENA